MNFKCLNLFGAQEKIKEAREPLRIFRAIMFQNTGRIKLKKSILLNYGLINKIIYYLYFGESNFNKIQLLIMKGAGSVAFG